MPLLPIPEDGYDSRLSAALDESEDTIYVSSLPAESAGFKTIFEEDGETIREEIYHAGIASSPNRLTGVVRRLGWASVAGVFQITPSRTATDHPAHRRIAGCSTAYHVGRALSILNGLEALPAVPKLPSSRTISDSRHLIDKEYCDAAAAAAGGIMSLYVTEDSGLAVNVAAGTLLDGDDRVVFAGASSQAIVDDATNYIQISRAGVLDINQSGFSGGNLPLSIAVTSGGAITSIVDSRPFFTVGPEFDLIPTAGEKAALAGTVGTPSDENKFVTDDDTVGTGKALRESVLNTVKFLYGDGSDGDVEISEPTTLTRDMHYENLTIGDDDVDTAGFKVFVRGKLTRTGTAKFKNNGNNGGNGTDAVISTAGTGGAGGAAAGTGSCVTVIAGKAGANGVGSTASTVIDGNDGTNGENKTYSLNASNGANGGRGGYSGAGNDGAGGSGGTTTNAPEQGVLDYSYAMSLFSKWLGSINPFTVGGTGGSGGSGEAGASNSGGGWSGGGGGSGSSGGLVYVVAYEIDDSGSGDLLQAVGGNGGAGGKGFDNYAGVGTTSIAGGGGGGAGGRGGYVFLAYGSKNVPVTVDVSGGTGGAGGIGYKNDVAGGNINGVSGGNGPDGGYTEINLS